MIAFLALGLLVATAFATLDYAMARHSRALLEAWRGGSRHAASRWSVAAWAAGSVGFCLTVKYSMSLLPFEAVGLYIGTWFAARKRTPLE